MRITVAEAARRMGVSYNFLRMALQQEKFPFGIAVKTSSVYTYYVDDELLELYLQGKAMSDEMYCAEQVQVDEGLTRLWERWASENAGDLTI